MGNNNIVHNYDILEENTIHVYYDNSRIGELYYDFLYMIDGQILLSIEELLDWIDKPLKYQYMYILYFGNFRYTDLTLKISSDSCGYHRLRQIYICNI